MEPSAPSATCFHCGLANHNANLSCKIKDEIHYFCCPGCKAVAQLIVELGNEDYYEFKKSYSTQAIAISDKTSLEKLELFDKAEIQQEFVENSNGKNGYKEAFVLLENLRCAACVWLNEQHLRQLTGVEDVHVDYTSQQARIKWNPQLIKFSEILTAIEAIGYRARPFDPSKRKLLNQEQKRKNYTRLLFTAILGMEVMAHAIATYWMGGFDTQGKLQLWEQIGRYTDLIVVTIMIVYAGADFFISAWRDLKNKHLGMDVPIVLGLSAAYIGSFIATIRQQNEVYFDSIAMFLFLMLAAKIYEMKGRLIAGASIDRLLKIVPKTARKVQDKQLNLSNDVLVSSLKAGDEIIIKPGEIVPVDGQISIGKSSFDESLLTGEVMPVIRQEGDKVINGSCNIDQTITMKVVKVQANSTLYKIFSLLEKGLEGKTKYVQLSTKIAQWFVLSIVFIAAITALFWYQYDAQRVLAITISVLIVSCPCALALATPVAISLSSGRLAHLGVLPLKMSTIEEFSVADTLVFDKTGTLTEAKAKLIKTQLLGDDSSHKIQDVIDKAVALECGLLHPIAQAFTDLKKQCPMNIKQKVNHPGSGVEGIIQGELWKIGKLNFCVDNKELPIDLVEQIKSIRKTQATVIGISKNHDLVAYFVLKDPLKKSAVQAVKKLKKLGIKNIFILSGDNPASVKPIAHTLSINTFYGSMSPTDKLNWIKSFQEKGHKIIMVGDGINDAPILAAADASVSFVQASDLAQINSDFVLLKNDLNLLPKIRTIATKTDKIIKQNFSWAIAYNFIAIPFAMSGYLPPWAAALGMSLSSFIVISNSLRLNFKVGADNEIL